MFLCSCPQPQLVITVSCPPSAAHDGELLQELASAMEGPPTDLKHWCLCCQHWAVSSFLKPGKYRASRPVGCNPIHIKILHIWVVFIWSLCLLIRGTFTYISWDVWESGAGGGTKNVLKTNFITAQICQSLALLPINFSAPQSGGLPSASAESPIIPLRC